VQLPQLRIAQQPWPGRRLWHYPANGCGKQEETHSDLPQLRHATRFAILGSPVPLQQLLPGKRVDYVSVGQTVAKYFVKPVDCEAGGEGGINIHRLNFANNTGKFLPLLPTLPVTCDRRAHPFYQYRWEIK
jgi:hypothetical protein